jgi:hypothetical protein
MENQIYIKNNKNGLFFGLEKIIQNFKFLSIDNYYILKK